MFKRRRRIQFVDALLCSLPLSNRPFFRLLQYYFYLFFILLNKAFLVYPIDTSNQWVILVSY